MEELWRRVMPDSRCTVYFGCGDGEPLWCLRQRNPQMDLVAVETDAALRLNAGNRGFSVLASAAAALQWLEQENCRVDAWIIAPAAWQDETLTRSLRQSILARMNDGGVVVWDFANQRYWQAVLRLLQGKPETAARQSLTLLVEDLRQAEVEGIEIVGIKAEQQSDPAEFQRFIDLATPLAKAAGVSQQEQQTLWAADRLLLRGWVRPADAAPLTIHAALGETKVCSRVRMDEPGEFLLTLPKVDYRKISAAERELPVAQRQVWIWQRRLYSYEAMVLLQRRLLAAKTLTIQEWDDDPLHWEAHFRQSRFAELRSAHAIQTSTPKLAEYLRQYNPEVRVFPNCIAELPPLCEPDPQAAAVTLFFGAINREQDWQPIMPVLNEILQAADKSIRCVVVHDQQFFAALRTEHKHFVPFCAFSEYRRLLQQSDIALLPLLPGRFNQMKSDLKFVECAAFGAAVLASPTVYADSVVDGETGLLYETPSEFAAGLDRLLHDAALRRSIRRQAWQWVGENRLLCRHYRERLAWYQSLRQRYDELTAAIGERVPELQLPEGFHG